MGRRINHETVKNPSNIDIHKLIDETIEKKDKTIHIFISDIGTTIDIEPINKKPINMWIFDKDAPRDISFACSECGAHFKDVTPYCPICGEKLSIPIPKTEVENNERRD